MTKLFNIKKVYTLIAVVLISTSFVVPTSAHASTQTQCTRIDTITEQVQNRIANRDTLINSKTDERVTKIQNRFANLEQKQKDARKTTDAKRVLQFSVLEKRAQTETQKQAVADFEKTVTDAITNHQQTVDTTNKQFEDAVLGIVQSTGSTSDEAINTFKTKVSAILVQAKANCLKGTSVATIRSQIKSAILNARATLSSTVHKNNSADSLVTLEQKRKDDITKAGTDFQSTLKQAEQKLKQSFGN